MKEKEDLLKKYLSENTIIVVDSMSSARVSLATQLVKLGAVRQKMELVGSIEEAKASLFKTDAKIIFTDYTVNGKSGLDLIQHRKEELEQRKIKDSLFVLVTGNASQSTVARAAEGDVDTFVIKPYALNTLKNSLCTAVSLKLNPSKYLMLIEDGREQLCKNQLDQAIETFTAAMKEHEQPTLACFYYGQAEQMKNASILAEQKYNQGLQYNKIHYKCLIGLFDLLFRDKKHGEAYEIVKRLAQYFPANPDRLATVLRLAIMTENFQDMEGYYRIYLKIDERTDDLVRFMCSALVVTGKYYLRQKVKTRALEVFQNASVSAGGRSNIILYIVECLVDFGMKDAAATYFERIKMINPASTDYRIAEYMMSTLLEKPEESIFLGKKLLRDGVETLSVYEMLMRQCYAVGAMDDLVELYNRAVTKWPHVTARLSEWKSKMLAK